MAALVDQTALFERLRPRLFGIAYRMLGTIEDGEDLVQDTFLRWQQADQSAIREPEAWLVTVVTRLSINRLRRVQTEREAYAGQWLPEPVPTGPWRQADERAELASDLSVAFLVMLERLSPEERAALLLREVFESDYREIAEVLQRSEAACRQVVHRARQRVRQSQARFPVSREATERLVGRFLSALQADDRDGVMALLAEDVAWTSDGGGKVSAVRNVVRGPLSVARLLLGIRRKEQGRVEYRLAWLNGDIAWVGLVNDRIFWVTAFLTDGDRVRAVYRVLNPDKLTRVGDAATWHPMTASPR